MDHGNRSPVPCGVRYAGFFRAPDSSRCRGCNVVAGVDDARAARDVARPRERVWQRAKSRRNPRSRQ